MKDDARQFLSLLGRAPARLSAEQTACVLNCAPYDIPVLVAARLLKPLGTELSANTIKYYATCEVLELADDVAWLTKATATIQRYWQKKNRQRMVPSAALAAHSVPFQPTIRKLARL
jgi:hypothetical protein